MSLAGVVLDSYLGEKCNGHHETRTATIHGRFWSTTKIKEFCED
jgi:hypothetical protein